MDYGNVPTQAATGVSTGVLIIELIIAIIVIASLWKLFSKAGQPGWAAIIPIYNVIVWLNVIKRPIWWIILLFIPFVNIIIMIIMDIDTAKAFGKDVGFGIGIIFFPYIFLPILAFGNSEYQPEALGRE